MPGNHVRGRVCPARLVNTLRERVRAWREADYEGVTPITQQLLRHWDDPEGERKLFFCQRETTERLIWLMETPLQAQSKVFQSPKT
jgi:type III restriction enzyme